MVLLPNKCQINFISQGFIKSLLALSINILSYYCKGLGKLTTYPKNYIYPFVLLDIQLFFPERIAYVSKSNENKYNQ